MGETGTPGGFGEADDDGDEGEEEEEEGEFYTEGSPELLEARRQMARYSLPRAKQRVEFQRLESTIPVETHVRFRRGVKEKLSLFELGGSQIASERPVSIVRFSSGGDVLACGDWGGGVKVLGCPDLETKRVLRGHRGMVGGVGWAPSSQGLLGGEEGVVDLATGGGEGDVHLWSLTPSSSSGQQQEEEADITPLATLSGHGARVVRTEFHPSGFYLASASYDTTWRLWDIATTQQLLLQEGHAKEVYAVSFNGDGSLLASAGLDSIGRIWDLRTGRTIMLLESHVAPIHALDWSPDGVRLMTGSADGFAKCWDLRNVREAASLGAHRGGVSDLRWYKGVDGPGSGKGLSESGGKDTAMTNGDTPDEDQSRDVDPDSDISPGGGTGLIPKKSGAFVTTAGFDNAVNIFSADDWALCRSLTGHSGTVLAVDVTADARWIASCGRDRTVKVWGREDGEPL